MTGPGTVELKDGHRGHLELSLLVGVAMPFLGLLVWKLAQNKGKHGLGGSPWGHGSCLEDRCLQGHPRKLMAGRRAGTMLCALLVMG